MYLSDKKNGTPRKPDDHEELEVLLESFAKQVEEIVNEAENIQVSVATQNNSFASIPSRRAWNVCGHEWRCAATRWHWESIPAMMCHCSVST